MRDLSKLLMNLAIKMAFGKITPLPWHIEPIVKELVICSFLIGMVASVVCLAGFVLFLKMVN
jgi:hypothetical protein